MLFMVVFTLLWQKLSSCERKYRTPKACLLSGPLQKSLPTVGLEQGIEVNLSHRRLCYLLPTQIRGNGIIFRMSSYINFKKVTYREELLPKKNQQTRQNK